MLFPNHHPTRHSCNKSLSRCAFNKCRLYNTQPTTLIPKGTALPHVFPTHRSAAFPILLLLVLLIDYHKCTPKCTPKCNLSKRLAPQTAVENTRRPSVAPKVEGAYLDQHFKLLHIHMAMWLT
jgi:hypothetical protein